MSDTRLVGKHGTVVVGGSVEGEINTANEWDWFAVTLEAGRTYRIDLKGSSTADGTMADPYLNGIYNTDGFVLYAGSINDNGGTGQNSRAFFTANEDETYWVIATGARGSKGTYTLSVADVTGSIADDFVAYTNTAGTVAVGGEATGEIEFEGDRDWFAVTLEEGKTYKIDLKASSTDDGTLADPYFRGVYDANGILLVDTRNNDGGEGRNSRVFFTATEDATYYLAAGAYGGDQGTYTLSVAEVTDDYAGNTNTAGTVAVGGEATGEIEFEGDRDWFAVTLAEGKTYKIDLKASSTDDGTLADPYFRGVYDANGILLVDTQDDDGGEGRNSQVFFTATEDATYYLATGAYGGDQGTYTLSVAEVTDDYAGNTNTAGTVAVGGEATGEIEFEGDRDWFAVTLEEGKTYQIDLNGSMTDDGTLADPYFRGVYDANGILLVDTRNNDGGEGRNSRVFFTATEDATYYLATGAYGGNQGTYTLSVAEVTDDYAGNTNTAGTVAVGGEATGEIEFEGDHDWFAVTLEEGKTYQIDLNGSMTDDGTLADPYFRGVYDANGILLVDTRNNDGGEGRNSRVFFTATEDATYYLATGAYGGNQGTYTLSVAEVTDDYAGNTNTAGTVAVGGEATGEIEFEGDHDWFAVTLEEGKTYKIDVQGSPTNDGTLSDPHLRGVYDADGAYVPDTLGFAHWRRVFAIDGKTYIGDVFNSSRINFTPDEGGTYYLSAGSSGGTGTYKISVAEIADDYAGNTSTTGSIPLGTLALQSLAFQSAPGDIQYEKDHDWFMVNLTAGETYVIHLEGANTESGTLLYPHLHGVFDAEGAQVTGVWHDDAVHENARAHYTPDRTGTYYLAVSGGHYGPSFHDRDGQGTYKLSVNQVSNDDYTQDTSTSGSIMVDGSVTGEIDFDSDRDWFAVTLEAGKSYKINVQGSPTNDGTLSDPHLRGIYDADGVKYFSTSDDNGGTGNNSQEFFVPEQDGVYFLALGATYGSGRGTYTLSVAEIQDDYRQDTSTSGSVAVDGSVMGDIDFDSDRDWFAVTLEAGKTYQIDLKGLSTGDGTLSDPYLRGVHDSDGTEVIGTSNYAGGTGNNSRAYFTPDEDGTYYVAAGELGTDKGTYTLAVAEAADDYPQDTSTTGAITITSADSGTLGSNFYELFRGSAIGEVEFAGDRDWFAVTLETGKTYTVEVNAPSTGDGALSDPKLYGLHDSNGTLVPHTSHADRSLIFAPPEGGFYYVAVGSRDATGTGTYTVSVSYTEGSLISGCGTFDDEPLVCATEIVDVM